MKILLTGNPNVGKSVVFSYLTGFTAISSNYPGTTVEILKGKFITDKKEYEVIDVPGAYSIEPSNKAEEVAVALLNKNDYDFIVHVLDSNNLERNLFFALQILDLNKPTIFLLNKWDIAKNRGIKIDVKGFSETLGVEIIPIIATTGWGIDVLINKLKEATGNFQKFLPKQKIPEKSRWEYIGEITKKYQKIEHKHPSFLEKLELITTTPNTAIPFAIGVMIFSFFAIRFIGETLINYVLDPVFNNLYIPALLNITSQITDEKIRIFLLGKNPAPLQSFGILTTALYIPAVAVFPYILSFYFILGLLEDIGYLPRLAIILDRASHKLGLHGYGTIPLIMGLGCKVPGIFALRILETNKEKIIAASLLFLMSPCMPQSAMIFSLLGKFPFKYTLIVFAYIFLIGLVAGIILNKIIKQEPSDLFIEVPPYQMPLIRTSWLKIKLRLKEFFIDAVPLIIAGVAIINLLDMFNILSKISAFFSPIFSNLLNLPGEMAGMIVLGFLKKDVAISMLFPFNLSLKQMMISSVFLVAYMPCIASLFVLFKELGKKTFYVISFNFFLSFALVWIFKIILDFIIY